MNIYIIRNDRTGTSFTATAAEAKLYAIGGPLDTIYSVFLQGGSGCGLTVHEIK